MFSCDLRRVISSREEQAVGGVDLKIATRSSGWRKTCVEQDHTDCSHLDDLMRFGIDARTEAFRILGNSSSMP
jgi:hypothetical protein